MRNEDKPLFGGLASRQADCVSALVRLAAVTGQVSTAAIVKQHCITLLAGTVFYCRLGACTGSAEMGNPRDPWCWLLE